ncbi:hydrolase [candidate division KSB3 bacterium]|uniref:Hydrolase n=1 Tax=candidate division KSB3 bacterium TaxID=2044937 RepID=A0A2G6KBS3_9BACT|nr:MAG: hydrolase [candidate division KSB3 bacterium]
MLSLKNTAIILIDVQIRLMRVMHDREHVLDHLQQLVKGARALQLPILWAEQNPDGLGTTIPELTELLTDNQPIVKRCFSCCGQHQFVQQLRDIRRKQLLLAGIETHVCVYQTAMDLHHMGYEVQIVTDAVSSRTPENKQIGLERMKEAGMLLTSTEMALFELLRLAEGPQFKDILNIVK